MPSKVDSGHDWQSEHTRNGTFNVCANCKQTYGRHDKRCPKARTPIRETEIKPEPAPAVVARRAARVVVDGCSECPFAHDDSDGYYECKSPTLDDDDKPSRSIPSKFKYEAKSTAPDWCPIRKLVVLIGGPKNA